MGWVNGPMNGPANRRVIWQAICVLGATSLAPCCGPSGGGKAPSSSFGNHDTHSACASSLQNPAELLPGIWDAVYTDPDGTGEEPPYTGPRTFSLRFWNTASGLAGSMSHRMGYETVTVPLTSIEILGTHVTTTATAPTSERVITVQGYLHCPGPVLNGNKTVSTDPDVTPLRFEREAGL